MIFFNINYRNLIVADRKQMPKKFKVTTFTTIIFNGRMTLLVFESLHRVLHVPVYREIFTPVSFSPLVPSLSAGEFKTANPNFSNYLSFNTVVSGII